MQNQNLDRKYCVFAWKLANVLSPPLLSSMRGISLRRCTKTHNYLGADTQVIKCFGIAKPFLDFRYIIIWIKHKMLNSLQQIETFVTSETSKTEGNFANV